MIWGLMVWVNFVVIYMLKSMKYYMRLFEPNSMKGFNFWGLGFRARFGLGFSEDVILLHISITKKKKKYCFYFSLSID